MEQLKIKIKNARDLMAPSGRQILSMYPDKSTPILDLFVRESLQNSLDAADCQNKFVKVNYKTGVFNTSDLCDSLETISFRLNKKIDSETSRYLSVRDSNTIGLTGRLSIDEVTRYQYGNLIKLVYDICNPQEAAGAGGSWGQGKTIYFRLGVGLVFYYSRIFNEETRSYESRLAGCLIEDERSRHALLPTNENGMSSGIAWWGDITEEGNAKPVTDETVINDFLNIFKIVPFKENETGTEIIIPFVNEKLLLLNNRVNDENGIFPNWVNSIDSYLNVAVQKWYFTRLNNPLYPYGPFLKIKINGNSLSEMLPLFRIGQIMYNKAIDVNYCYDDYPIDVKVEPIRINTDLTLPIAGHLITTLVNERDLGMCPPENYHFPYYYLDLEADSEENAPIFSFCRRPGMLVSYNKDVTWIRNVPYTPKDKFAISLFVLNSENSINCSDKDLEEYVRGSEMANHDSWEDYTFEGQRKTIIDRIKRGCATKLRRIYGQNSDDDNQEKMNSGLGLYLADLVLPPVGFGKRSKRVEAAKSKTNAGTIFSSHTNLKYGLKPNSIIYDANTLTFTYEVKASTSKIDHFDIFSMIGSEAGNIELQQWENNGMSLPFDIRTATINVVKLDRRRYDREVNIYRSDNTKINDCLSCSWLKTEGNSTYGLRVELNEKHLFNITVTFCLEIKSKNLQPVIKAESKE